MTDNLMDTKSVPMCLDELGIESDNSHCSSSASKCSRLPNTSLSSFKTLVSRPTLSISSPTLTNSLKTQSTTVLQSR